jgi:MFS family permease
MWRVVQGAGAGASMTIALAIVRDLFEGQAACTKLSYVAIATTIVPMIAPRHCSPSPAGASSMPKAKLPRSALIGFPVLWISSLSPATAVRRSFHRCSSSPDRGPRTELR